MRNKVSAIVALAGAIAGTVVWAQVRGGGSEWLTANGDAQRTSWIRTDAVISVDAFKTPGFELQWKSTLANQPRQLHSLAQGVTANGVTLFVPMSLVTGSSNNVFAIDNDTGYVVWQRHFEAPLPAPSASCPGGITAPATRIVSVVPPVVAAGRGAAGGGGGRGGGYRGAVGEPGEGVPLDTSARGAGAGRAGAPGAAGAAGAAGAPAAGDARSGGAAAPAGAAGAAAAPAGAAGAAAAGRGVIPGGAGGGARGGGAGDAGIPGAPAGLPGGGFGRPAGVVYTVASDGVLHVLGIQTGKDLQKPAPFLPANARWSDLIAVKETLYASTTENCGGAPNGVWAIDLASEAKPVTSWKTNGGGVTGMAFTTDGTLLATVGKGQAAAAAGAYANAIVALDPKTLQPKDWFTDPAIEFATLPLIFKSNDKEIVAAATKDGRILLLDASSLGGANHSTPLYASRAFTSNPATFAPEALALWQEMVAAPAAAAPAAATAPPPQGAPPGVPQGPLTTAPAAPGAAGGPPAGAVAAMQAGTTWLLLPVAGALPADAGLPNANGAVTNGAIIALKVVDAGGKLSLQPGWVSRDLTAPVTPLIVNGVVFAASSGKPQAAAGGSAADLARRGTPAVVYALNGLDGKELWSSGKTITSFLSGRSFWSATGQVYAGTFDGTLYAFGPPMDRK